ncbi:aspartyl/asparaginyl beta-hydroxylase isoform X2 [Coccinella septempunctata]|uniref:aspartyl/asparaginyl beta-hydroxylase isoform X2 n=1 Tax=Coccinella septempunctata TaxID=41139 RepID=UPI001D0760F2|nr:aspartyl/asparaginyl beta-hydroxylase isoform X2 [Coccinella septempunctata]
MSGDVQPRKRKDKKRKREEESVPLSFYPKETTEDVNIHVHKEEGTGGGICAKIVFFILFSALIILIGLIITEHRGLTDLDVAESESRYSQIFEGWVDNDKHDDHTLDDHDNEHFDDEEDNNGDGHTLDDHDDEHIDDEPSEEREHTLDDHDNEHFDDDKSNQLSEENEEDGDEDPEEYSAPVKPGKYRYRRKISEEEEDENVTESQQDDETEEEVLAESETKEDDEDDSENREEDEDEDNDADSQQDLEDYEETKEESVADSRDEDDTDEMPDEEDRIISEEEDNGIADNASSEYHSDGDEREDSKNVDEKETMEDKDENDEAIDQDDSVKESGPQESREDERENQDQAHEVIQEESTGNLPDNSGVGDNPATLSTRTGSPDQEDSGSDKLSEDNNDYEYSSITNENDWHIHKDLDEAQRNLPNNAAKALRMFENILEKYPSSPRGLYGLASALDALAEAEKSNKLLEEAVANYLKIFDLRDAPDELFKMAMERCIDRVRFRGRYGKAVTIHLKLIERFPDEPKYRNQLVVTYLTMGRVQQARVVLEETLQKWPDDGCALVHYGFIWKTTDNDLMNGVHYMQKGIDTKDPCAIDGRFFFHLGDALFRLGYKDKALKLYEDGVEHKLFLSKYQRSLYNVPRLTARPWWGEDQLTPYKLLFTELQKNWKIIRNEGLSVLNEKGYFQDESENLRNTGEWKQFELFARGRKHTKNCYKTPVTCRIIERHPDASGCRRGQTKFSVMHPGTHVWAHCGPTNCRLRVHLGLKVPPHTFLRVGEEIRGWEDGKLLIFDDSFEHEVWHNGTDKRLVLIVDVWHPELSMTERETLSSL